MNSEIYKTISFILILWFLVILTSNCKADSLAFDSSFGPNVKPSYGMDFTKSYGNKYIDYSYFGNDQGVYPSVSFGFQYYEINFGLVSASNIVNGSVSGLGGLELGYTVTVMDLFFIKASNNLLRDTNNNLNYGITMSSGINF